MDRLTVYYNSVCPVCRAGIRSQRARMAQQPRAAVEWVDLSCRPDALAAEGVSLDDVRRKLHVRTPDGTLQIGIDAFCALWRRTPGQRWLAALVALPGLRWLARQAYDRFADWLFAWNRRNGRW